MKKSGLFDDISPVWVPHRVPTLALQVQNCSPDFDDYDDWSQTLIMEMVLIVDVLEAEDRKFETTKCIGE